MRVKNDRVIQYSLLCVFVLMVCHGWQAYDSGWMLEPIIRFAFCVVYLCVVPFAGRNSLLYILPAFAYSIVYFNRFQNYTSFFIICLTVLYFKKHRNLYLVLYALSVIASLLINKRSASHALIHFINCSFIYFTLYNIDKMHVRKVTLDRDEKQILEALSTGIEIKEITTHSKNTVFKYMKSAREKAGVQTNAELLTWYMNEYKNGNDKDKIGNQD